MKRSDELNAQAEKIVNSAIDDLPKKYKGYVGNLINLLYQEMNMVCQLGAMNL